MAPRIEPIGDGWFQVCGADGRPGVMVGSRAEAKKELEAIIDRLTAELAAQGQTNPAALTRCECGTVVEAGCSVCPECGARVARKKRVPA